MEFLSKIVVKLFSMKSDGEQTNKAFKRCNIVFGTLAVTYIASIILMFANIATAVLYYVAVPLSYLLAPICVFGLASIAIEGVIKQIRKIKTKKTNEPVEKASNINHGNAEESELVKKEKTEVMTNTIRNSRDCLNKEEQRIRDSVLSRNSYDLFKNMGIKELKEVSLIYLDIITKYEESISDWGEPSPEERYEYIQTKALYKQACNHIVKLSAEAKPNSVR